MVLSAVAASALFVASAAVAQDATTSTESTTTTAEATTTEQTTTTAPTTTETTTTTPAPGDVSGADQYHEQIPTASGSGKGPKTGSGAGGQASTGQASAGQQTSSSGATQTVAPEQASASKPKKPKRKKQAEPAFTAASTAGLDELGGGIGPVALEVAPEPVAVARPATTSASSLVDGRVLAFVIALALMSVAAASAAFFRQRSLR